MNYWEFSITAQAEIREILLGLLSGLPFDSFQETETGFSAFLPENGTLEEVEAEVRSLADWWGFSYQVFKLPAQNWNEIWESNFPPVLVESFCGIRADFHPPFEAVRHEIVINPKMAFGTGHHETTHMMIQLMENLPFAGLVVLDYGCGTGILAILAALLGASSVDAVDIEEAAVDNSRENAGRNGVDQQLHLYLGDLNAVPPKTYQVILANINRNVILESLPALNEKLGQGGILLISGILISDRDVVMDAARQAGFKEVASLERGNWMAAHLQKIS